MELLDRLFTIKMIHINKNIYSNDFSIFKVKYLKNIINGIKIRENKNENNNWHWETKWYKCIMQLLLNESIS